MRVKIIAAALALTAVSACGSPSETEQAPVAETAIGSDAFIGDWAATLKVPGGPEVPIILHIEMGADDAYNLSLDSPDQGAFGLSGTNGRIEDGTFLAEFPVVGANVKLTREGETLTGLFIQGLPLPVTFTPADPVEPPNRPQEDALVRDYVINEVTFDGGDEGVSLHGELTMPNGSGPFPGVVLISGSGPQNKDEELMGHKPFLILSDYLTRNGYAVLRYNDRDVGPSTGDFKTATTQDFAEDAAAAMRQLKDTKHIATGRTGYIGHSEGGFIAPLATQMEPADFMVFLAGPSQTLPDVIIRQSKDLGAAMGTPETTLTGQAKMQAELFAALEAATSDEEAISETRRIIAGSGLVAPAALNAQVEQMTSPWMRWMVTHDPLPSIRAYDGPVLALYGGKDLQVAPDANAPDMETALGHPASVVKTLPGLNHLFQPAETGAMTEYAKIEITFDEGAMQEVVTWLDSLNLQ